MTDKNVCEITSPLPTEGCKYEPCEEISGQNSSVSIKKAVKSIILFVFTIGFLLLIFSPNSSTRDRWTQTNGQIIIEQYQIHMPLAAAEMAAEFRKSLKKRSIVDGKTFHQNGEAVCFYVREKGIESYLNDFGLPS